MQILTKFVKLAACWQECSSPLKV